MTGLIFKLTLCVGPYVYFILQTFTILFRLNAFINVYYNFFWRLSHLWANEANRNRRAQYRDDRTLSWNCNRQDMVFKCVLV